MEGEPHQFVVIGPKIVSSFPASKIHALEDNFMDVEDKLTMPQCGMHHLNMERHSNFTMEVGWNEGNNTFRKSSQSLIEIKREISMKSENPDKTLSKTNNL